MENLIFSQAGVAQLVKIRRQIEHEFGFQFKLADTESFIDFLTAASISPDSSIRACFMDFLTNLNQEQRQRLQSLGLDLPNHLINQA
ncbi:MAG: hypothetical protein LJE74_08355 [Proteobacteria bacterium]|jgi:hypothetical protein|nr:hypothetical protein [Pseudomonadota bacterium]MCG6934541.1 hypothetical protein [Pseudomonadota bacterium]